MSTDPVQMLIDAGAIPSSPFEPGSRYHGVAIALLPQADGEAPLPFVRRRFIAQPRDLTLAGAVTVSSSDRPDLLAHRTLGDALLYWKLADANAVTDPFELTDQAGARVVIPLPGSA